MMELYNPATLHMDYLSLLKTCESVFETITVRANSMKTFLYLIEIKFNHSLQVTSDQTANLEVETRGQSANKLWFLHKAGRVTASNMKSAARTNHSKPSQSLIKRLCYPEAFKFFTKFTRCVIIVESILIVIFILLLCT